MQMEEETYSSVFSGLSPSPLESNPVALVLETLRSNQSLDLGSLGERFLALNLGLNIAADNVLANLQ